MSRLSRQVTHAFYVRVAKPVMFRFSPDSVHRQIIGAARFFQRFSVIRWLLSHMWSYRSDTLAQRLHGIELANPIGLSAGFDKNVQVVPLMESIGFGFATCGSVTGRVCQGNPRPWFHRLPELRSIVVNAGLPNRGSRAIAAGLARDKRTAARGMPLVLSVARTNTRASSTDAEGIADYVQALQRLKPYADMFEINISCPNTYGGEPFTTPGRLRRLLGAISELKLAQPITIKMPSNLPWSKFDALLRVIIEAGIPMVTISNLRKDRTGIDVSAAVKGNLSGGPTHELSNELIRRTYSAYGHKLTIIGVGGVFSAEDAYTKIKHGASLVGLLTGLIYEGPSLIGSINQELEQLMRADGYTHISQVIGSATKKS